MKLPRVSAVVAAAVLAPAVLFPSTASAADAPKPAGLSGPDTASDTTPDTAPDTTPATSGNEDDQAPRQNRLRLTRIADGAEGAGPVLRKAAAKALDGSYQDILDFLATGQYAARAEDEDRAKIEAILADPKTGRGVRETGEKALKGSAADLRHFLEVELPKQQADDNRVEVARMLNGGPALHKAASKALDGSYQDILDFLATGQYAARAEDEDRAKVEAILADPETGRGVREAGEKALTGGAADLRHFLEVELPKQQADDNRVKVSQILSSGGPAVREAANRAMDGDDAAILTFLKEGWPAAKALDEAAAKQAAEQAAKEAAEQAAKQGGQGGQGTGGTGEAGQQQAQQPQAVQPAAFTQTTGSTVTGAGATASQAGSLAATGTDGLGWEAGGAAAALAAGAAMVALSRRRSTGS